MTDSDIVTPTDGSVPKVKEPVSEIDSLVIAVPPGWIRIPLDRDEFNAAIRANRRQLTVDSPISKTDLRRLDLTISALRNDLESANVRLLAALIMSVDGETEDESGDPTAAEGIDREDLGDNTNRETLEGEGPRLLLATLSVSVLSRFELGSDVPLTPSVLKVAFDLERQRPSDEHIRVTNLEPPEIVDIPAGKAVRLVQLHSSARAVPEPADLFVQQFYVPLDPNGDEAALVLFTSPSIEVAQVLSGLFEAMMETFEILSDTADTDVGDISVPEEGSSRTHATDASEVNSDGSSIGGHAVA